MKACEACDKMKKKGKGHEPPFIIDEMDPADIHKLQSLWLQNHSGVPATICQDASLRKLNI